MSLAMILSTVLEGLGTTLSLWVLSLGIGALLALLWSLFVLSEQTQLKAFANGVICCIRGTPLLIQIFLIYYGIAQIHGIDQMIFWPLFKSPFNCMIIALSLNTSAYTAVIIIGAVQSAPKWLLSSAHATGLSTWQSYRKVILPYAINNSLTPYSNEVVMMLKNTALASTITLLGVMGQAQMIMSSQYQILMPLACAGVIYLILNSAALLVFKVHRKPPMQ